MEQLYGEDLSFGTAIWVVGSFGVNTRDRKPPSRLPRLPSFPQLPPPFTYIIAHKTLLSFFLYLLFDITVKISHLVYDCHLCKIIL